MREGKKRDWGHNLCLGRFAPRERQRERERERETQKEVSFVAQIGHRQKVMTFQSWVSSELPTKDYPVALLPLSNTVAQKGQRVGKVIIGIVKPGLLQGNP